MTFAERVHDLREAAGIPTTKALAEKVGVKQPSMWAIENGSTKPENIKTGTFMALVRVLRTNPAYLWTGNGPMGIAIDPNTEEAEAASICRQLEDEKLRDAWLANGRHLIRAQPDRRPSQDDPYPAAPDKRRGPRPK